MSGLLLLSLLLIGGDLVLAAAPPDQPGLLDFLSSQRSRQYTNVSHEVLAFYYPWYGLPDRHGKWIHWGGENKAAHDVPESRHYPAQGAYDSRDPAVIASQIAEARTNGMTGFIASWWGQGSYEDRSFQLLLNQADRDDFKTSIYWEAASGKGEEQIHRAITDLVYILKNYGAHKSFLKVDGKPVIFVYGRVMGEVPLTSWPEIINGARAGAGDFLLIADGYQESFARMFDGLHTYNICAQVKGKSPDKLREWAARYYSSVVKLARRRGRISCVTVIPGYDDTKIRKPGLAVPRQDGRLYRTLWQAAIHAQPDWVLITSFNEWHEGSEVEPSWEDGDKYLQLTREFAPRFLAGKTVRRSSFPAMNQMSEKARELQALFKGRTVGLLPDPGEAAFWLLDAGLPVKQLSWAEVTDPNVFNPHHFPLVLQSGGEHYSSNGRGTQDVLPALQRYLARGGFLLSMPNQPFPFYYDDATGRPQPVANRIGLPVRSGWEQPPADSKLVFHIKAQALAGLPAVASFPADGDLRWRPADRTLAGDGSSYEPLASLVDSDGRTLGDGIAYVKFHDPPLKDGQMLYVWMRMGDVVGGDRLMSAILEFAGKKMLHPADGD